MSIIVKSDSIYIDGETVTFEDIYKAASDSIGSLEKKAQKVGDNSYYFDYSLYVGKNSSAAIKDKNTQVIINGEYLQVYENSYLKLGEKDENGAVYGGCTINMPNVKNAYGFGCKDKDDIYTLSGNLYLYASTINIYGFWGFFNKPDKQDIEIIDCIINGYGRFSGNNSILKDITFIKSINKYGTLSTLGDLKQIDGIKLNKVTSDDASALYFNPKISKNCLIKNFESYHHDVLVYCESTPDIYTMTLLDPKIPKKNVYKFKDNKAFIRINYSVKFITKNPNIEIEIYDSNKNQLYSFFAGNQPLVNLNYLTINRDATIVSEPYTIVIDNTFVLKILPSEILTIDIDLLYERNRRRNDLEFFINSQDKFELGTLIQVFVKSYVEPTISIHKFNGEKILEPISVSKVDDDILYRVEFLLGDIGEIGLNNKKWVEGQYYLKGFDLNKDFPFYKNITLIEEKDNIEDNEASIKL